MARKQKPIDAGPSKAYLVSFGDTMTALLAFFIVLNSLAKDQTGANMYAGTGSFVNAFAKSGTPGGMPGNRSSDMIQQAHQAPIYALAKNLEKNESEGSIGPDDTQDKDRVLDREKEEFQKFLSKVESNYGLESKPSTVNQVVFDSFDFFDKKDGSLSEHAIKLAAEMIPKLRKSNSTMETIVWAAMPSRAEIQRKLSKSHQVKTEIESLFWLKPNMKSRMSFTVKPWLFKDAKRPVISFVISETRAEL
jgi:flagellar motor protein MotB